MSVSKYFAVADDPARKNPHFDEGGPRSSIVTMDGGFFKGCIFGEASWLNSACRREGLVRHDSDELLVFIGSNPDDPENLNMEIELQLENDKLVLTNTCFVFIPAGAAHGNFEVKNVKKPALYYTFHLNTDTYAETPAEATAAPGTFSGNVVERYERVDGTLPEAPEGFLTLLLWIDGKKLAGAPYMEAVWFKTTNDTGPEEHVHDFDEFIGFFGSDPSEPDELGAELTFFIEGEQLSLTKSFLVYIPRGVRHSPILVPKLDRPIIHFSGGNGGDYAR